MASPARQLCDELADDFGWLEQHARKSPDHRDAAVPLRFAAAIVRNLVTPYVDGVAPPPLHVAVVGGAGTGKSTIANLLCGATVAEANPQAGFTRHPVAYTRGDAAWAEQDGMLGPLRRLHTPGPSNLDDDFYQVRTLHAAGDTDFLKEFVVWDCPDMTTWAATGYAPRLLEVAGLADVIVFVASDERYNDAVPTQYLRLFLEAGKPVVVVLTKMRPEQAAELAEHFKGEVLRGLPPGRVAVLAVPHLSNEELADPAHRASAFRIPLLNQLAVFGEWPALLRERGSESAVHHLRRSSDRLLAVARNDLDALDEWTKLVRGGRAEFEDRYRREYLTGAKFHRFDEALVRLIDLLELPGAGKFVAGALYVVRTPYRLLKGVVGKMLGPPNAAPIPEQPVLDAAFAAWLDRLRATALANEKRHELWAQVARGFDAGLGDELTRRYRDGLKSFQLGQSDEIDRTARAIYEDLEKSPGTLKALRGGKLAFDVAAIGACVVLGGINWHDFILVPLAASVSQQLVEWAGAGYVEAQKEKARQRQLELVAANLSRPLEGWLEHWPAAAGSSYERLKTAVRRVPESLARIEEALPRGPR
jgi:hypothetical protein